MLSGTLIKTTLVDYPSRVAATWFLCGCNLRCPYCYNGELVLNKIPSTNLVHTEQVYEHLRKRRNVLSGFVISGGEALIHPQISQIIYTVKSMGYMVKIDTNGLLPDKLEILFKSIDTKPDYVAIDIKTDPMRYNLLGFKNDASPLLRRSIAIASTLPLSCLEFRTVLVPPLVGIKDIETMANLLPKKAQWYFAPFHAKHCLDPSYNKIIPYTDSQMDKIVDFAKEFRTEARLR